MGNLRLNSRCVRCIVFCQLLLQLLLLLLPMPMSNANAGQLISRLTSDCYAITRCIATNVNVALRNLLQVIGEPNQNLLGAADWEVYVCVWVGGSVCCASSMCSWCLLVRRCAAPPG